MTNPSENWPKSFLLQIHAEAIAHGFVWVEPITEPDALSLKQRMYRIRRRSDKATATFIPPEYHLVTLGKWEPLPGEAERETLCLPLGRIPVIFSARPDGTPMPSIRPASGEEIEAMSTMPQRAFPSPLLEGDVAPALDLDPAALQIEEGEIGGLVEKMRKAALKKVN